MAIADRILLATDLSARSDRALDRAMMLARKEGAQLVVLHVIEPNPNSRFYPRTQDLPTLAALVRQQLLHDLGECSEKTTIRIEEGDPAEAIVRVARELSSTVVIVGVARVERLGRFVLGSTVERLVRGLETPLLIVTDRPRKPYERIAVAVDFSPVSTQMIHLATALRPARLVTAIHAFHPVTYGSSDATLAKEQWKEVAHSDSVKWLAASQLTEEDRARLTVRIEAGDPARVLRDAAAGGAYDLVVVGAKGRGPIFDFLLGGTAKRILAELPCDALFVREAR